MVDFLKRSLAAKEIKDKALALGADLVGIADGAAIDASHITDLDAGRVIVLAKRLNEGVARIRRWDDRHKYYNDELALTHLEETSLELVYWLEDCGYPALIVPPTHVDPAGYRDRPGEHLEPLLSLPHAAVEAGLGTLGLNLQLLTPQYGPRVILAAVLCSAEVECDRPMVQALCLGPSCGRCLKTCPGDAVHHWGRDWEACDRHRSPHGFAQLTEHLEKIVQEGNAGKRKELLRSEDSFNLWQSILRGAGVVTGCRRCADVCPVGADYAPMLADALEEIPENTAAKESRLEEMKIDPASGGYETQKRFIGFLKQV
jgi:epoxyqueuosine reductase QueG